MELKDKAIDIKGKKYVLVADRILFFNEKYPDGSIETELLSEPTSDKIVIKAVVKTPSVSDNGEFVQDGHGTVGIRRFTGHSQATVGDGYINKTSALENAETSAVGRALAMMGIGVIESVASADEMNKAMGSAGKPTESDLVCSICGTKGKISYKRNKDGVAYCPNFLKHKEDGVKNQMIPPFEYNKVKTQEEIDFDKMPPEK